MAGPAAPQAAHDFAVAHYHALIEADLASAEAQLAALVEAQREHGVLFGDRIATRSLRPTLLTETTYQAVQDACYQLRLGLARILRAIEHDERVLVEALGLREWELELVALPSRLVDTSTLARLDAFLTEDGTDGGTGFRFVEVNGESPAGLGYLHELAQIYATLPVFQAFVARHPVRFVSPLENTVQMLLRAYHGEHGGTEEHPTFAIVDHLDVPTVHEFRLIQRYLERHGFACVLANPEELEIVDGWVHAHGHRIHLLYKRLLVNEFWQMRDRCPAFLEGYRAGKTCYVNSLKAKLAHKKASLALLTDPTYADLLTESEHEAVRRHVPWTRRFGEGRATYAGTDVDLVAFIRQEQHRFVLKPNDEYGGKGVTLGFAASEAEWEAALEEGLRGNYVVQEVVDIHREPFLVKTGDGWGEVPTIIDLDPYLNGPTLGGCLTRTSVSNLANVTAGGGTLPMFVLRYA
ncbi:MAG TPA: hypothetical protein VD948_08455 [Rhodothermales bacterium]|nr:hypothetical protein [Rhodothermales bacterium]